MAGVNRMAWSRFFLYNAANGLPWSGIYAGARAGLPAGPAPAHTLVNPGPLGRERLLGLRLDA